jgi:hypothetical protein
MNPFSRLTALYHRILSSIDHLTLPLDPRWGVAVRVWGDARWSFLCLCFLLLILLHPPAGLPFRLCLFHRMFGVDCPGCGMTRGLSHLIRGHGVSALQSHPFSPLVLVYLIVQSMSPFLPFGLKMQIAAGMSRHEKLIGILFWILTGLFLLYGLGRATLQILLQGVSLPGHGVPSFRTGW